MKTGDKGPADEPLGSKADFTFTLGCWAPDGVDPKGFVVFFLEGKKYTSLPRQENNVKIFPQHNERSKGWRRAREDWQGTDIPIHSYSLYGTESIQFHIELFPVVV